MRRAALNKTNAFIRQIVAGWFCFALLADDALAANYSLSYSGRLTQQSGAAVEGPVDIQVSFWNANSGGVQRGETLTYLSVELNQGVFALNLDLRPDQVKAIFDDGSEAVFVEIAAAGKVYPRQQYLYVPFALRVPTDNTTVSFNDDGKLGFAGASSPTPNSYLSADGSGKLKWVLLEAGALSAKTVDNLAPSTGQVLTYNGTKWVAAASGSGTGGGSGNGGTVTSVSGTAPITVTNGSTAPVISLAQASGSVSGYLSYGDWNVFNSKQDALGYIPLNKTGDTMSGPLSVPLLTQAGTSAPSLAASGKGSIYFDSGSNQFKVSQNGSAYAPLVSAASVTSVEAGSGLSGGAITTAGTISLANTAVTPGSYTRANITVDQQGRLTAAASSPAIVDADISSSAAIAQSKVSGLVSALTAKEPSIAAGASTQYWRGDKTWQTLNTSNVPEGSNQYFTVARAVSALTGSGPITYSTTTGNIAISKASGTIDGYLSSSDWNNFSSKQDALGYAPLKKSGDTMSGPLDMNGQPLTAVGNVVLSAAKTLGLGVFDSASEPLMTTQLNSSGAASPDKGKTWFNSSTNQIKYWDGSSAQALGVSGAGLTSLNGQSGSTQSFQVNNSGLTPAINSGANTHTLSIPNASSAGVTGGVISNADYNSFNAKVGSIAGASGISVVNSGGTATVGFAAAGSAGTYTKVTTNSQGQVTSGSTLVAADIPGLDANKITGGQLAAANGGTGISSTATFPYSGVVVTEAAPETLTNKTLTATTINGASSIAGSTSINTSGAITSGALTAATIVSQGSVTLQGNGTTSSKLVLNDKGTNYLALKSPDTLAASTTWVLPSTDGTGGQVLATNGSGTLSWASGLAPTGVAGGDLGGNFPNPTVATVGASTAADIHNAELLANAATSSNTASTIVKRDGSGNFSAGTITANLTGNVSGTLTGNASTATSAGSFTGSLAGDVTGTQGATVVANVGGVIATNVAAGATSANAATNANTASTIVKRDASGNFAAGTITANLTGTASTATSAVSFTSSLDGDVTGTQGATVVSTVGTSSAANVHAAELAANAASSANGALAIVKRDSNGGFSSGQINATTPNATSQGVVVKGSASQSANLQEWQSSSGAVMSAVDSSGYLRLKDNDGTDNYVSLRASSSMASNLTYTLPGTISAGAYLTTDGSGNMSWSAPGSFTGSLTGDVTGTQGATTVANVGGITAANVAAGATLANAATNANTVSTIVKRDASGNFAAGTVTANLTGNVTGHLTGDVTGNVSGTAANVTGTVAVANGGTGATTLAANNVLLGNGTSAPQAVAPGASGNVLMSNGTTWASSTPTTNWAAPGAIGATTANSAAFTSLTASGNIGIGTTTPGAALDITGQIKIQGGTPGVGRVLTSDANGLASWLAPATGGTVTSVSGTGPVSVATGSTTPVISMSLANTTTAGYLSAADWNTFNGKQAALAAATSVSNGYLTSGDWVTFNSKQPAGNYITALTGDGTLSGFSAGSAALTLRNTGTAGTYVKVTTDAQGRVSSGVATIGNADIAAAAAIDATKVGGGGVTSAEFDFLGSVTSDIQTQLNNKAPSGNPNFTGAVAVPLGAVATPSLTFTGDTNTGFWSPAADTVAFSTAGTERARILSNGNVGIGTTAPGANLDVVGPWPTLRLLGTAGGPEPDLYFTTLNGSGTTTWSLRAGSSTTTTNFRIGTNGSQDMVNITTDGNVGIGTTAPEQNLSVQGFINVDQGDSDSGSTGGTSFHGITFGRSSGEGIGSKRTAGGNQWGLDFYTLWSNRMSITSAGNVGIGTTNPGSQLDVVGAARVSGGLDVGGGAIEIGNSSTTATTPYIDFHYGTGSAQDYNTRIINSANNQLTFVAGSVAAMTIQGGNVGIGTTAPAAALDVGTGNIKMGYSSTQLSVGPYTHQTWSGFGTRCANGLYPIYLSCYANNSSNGYPSCPVRFNASAQVDIFNCEPVNDGPVICNVICAQIR